MIQSSFNQDLIFYPPRLFGGAIWVGIELEEFF